MPFLSTFSEGKHKNLNEDYLAYNKNTFVIVDGSADITNYEHQNKTAGEIISKVVAEETLSSKLDGIELVKFLNNKIKLLYEELYISPEETKKAIYRFACGFICVRIVGKKLIITYLGNLGFRINGEKAYKETNRIDIINSKKRAKFIAEYKTTDEILDYTESLIEEQFKYQNNGNNELGYGVIDGSKTPSKFIKVFEHNLKDIKTVELFTDGYFKIAETVSIESWEEANTEVEEEDPQKYKKYKSMEDKDDRTLAIIEF